jgi:hypothetical protein
VVALYDPVGTQDVGAGEVAGPALPVAEPYTLLIAKPEGGAPSALGNVPSESMKLLEK